jgi:Zn-dependent peptidase ImmA (M78 family)
MTTRQQDSVLAAVALAFELSEWIDHRFELETVDLPDLRETEPADAAMMLRNYWGIGTVRIGNMVHLLESKGVRVFSLSERAKQVDACSVWYRGAPFVFLNTMKTVEHSRMDAAHELGHLVLHRHIGPRGRSVEPEAKAFAAAFLMPEDAVVSAVPHLGAPTMEQMVRLKAHWGVSLAALAFRLNQLRILPDWSYRRVCIELSSYGRAREPYPIPDRETSAVLARVFSLLKEEGTTKADVARALDLYTDDLDALIFGLGVLAATDTGHPKPDPTATALRRQFKVYDGSGS